MPSVVRPHYKADPNARELKNEKRELIIKPRGLNILAGNDSRYWRIPEEKDKNGAAELVEILWLEVAGSAELECNKKYEISFKVSLTDDAFGWSGCPLIMMAKFGRRGTYFWKQIDQIKGGKAPFQIPKHDKFQITSPAKDDQKQLFFGLYEVWSRKPKGGLKIHHVLIKQVD